MNKDVRAFLQLPVLWSCIGALSLALQVAPAAAQWKPTRDVEFVVPFGVGGGADLTARTVARIIAEEKLVPVSIQVVNRAGGGTSVGIAAVANNKRGDPHTLVLINPQSVITPIRIANSRGWRDLVPLANLMLDDYLLLAHRDAAFKNAKELVAWARGKPAQSLSVGSAGPADDMAIAVFEAATGLKFKIVRFDGGGQIQTMLLGKHVDLGSGNPLEFMGQIQAGAIRPLGVFRTTRFPLMSGVPTMKEQGIDTVPFQMWRGIAVPKDLPAEAMQYWQDVMRKVMGSKKFRDYLTSIMATEYALLGADFASFLEKQEALYKDMLARLEKGK